MRKGMRNMRTLEVDVELAKVGHTRESLFVLLDMLLPPSEMEHLTQTGTSTYTTLGGDGYSIVGKTKFAIEECIWRQLYLPIKVAERLASEYARLRGYARRNDGAKVRTWGLGHGT